MIYTIFGRFPYESLTLIFFRHRNGRKHICELFASTILLIAASSELFTAWATSDYRGLKKRIRTCRRAQEVQTPSDTALPAGLASEIRPPMSMEMNAKAVCDTVKELRVTPEEHAQGAEFLVYRTGISRVWDESQEDDGDDVVVISNDFPSTSKRPISQRTAPPARAPKTFRFHDDF